MKKRTLKIAAVVVAAMMVIGLGSVAFAAEPSVTATNSDTDISLDYDVATTFEWSAPADISETITAVKFYEKVITCNITKIDNAQYDYYVQFSLDEENSDDELTGWAFGQTIPIDVTVADTHVEFTSLGVQTVDVDIELEILDNILNYGDSYRGTLVFEVSSFQLKDDIPM